MIIEMFNLWYFFWLILLGGLTVGLYFLLRNRSERTQRIVLFGILLFGLLMHFLKVYYPPYSVDNARMLRDSWFVNICGANISLFPFIYLSKSKKAKDYMFYIGVISGLIALFYPQEPLAKVDQLAEQLDIIRFYFHHWMLLAVPLLMVLLGHHKLSYKRVFTAPTGLMIVMLYIMLNQIFQSELGFIPLRDRGDFFGIGYKNSSYIWGPGTNDAIGEFLAIFTPKIFKTVPVGEFAGQEKYWPWFWLLVPVYIIVPILSFLLSMIFDHKQFAGDVKALCSRVRAYVLRLKRKTTNAELIEDDELITR
ncbi:MAG: YwaF family protein [Clostridia bacterium]|nr:YwaF family protein [Clostridia bacterium]